VFERFTEPARRVVVLAQEEAREELRHNYVGTEHILLGLLREEDGLASQLLASLGISLESARAHVIRIVGSGEEVASGPIPFTPRAKRILELALREALSLGHNYIGTEHILLGLVRESEGVAVRVLLDFDADAQRIRNAVIERLPGPEGPQRGSAMSVARTQDFRLVVRPDRELLRLLMAAGGRALSDERNEFGLADLLAVAKDVSDDPTDVEPEEPEQPDT
jgi:ATP-dependent Clp protease ATP-binding subunit ClpC